MHYLFTCWIASRVTSQEAYLAPVSITKCLWKTAMFRSRKIVQKSVVHRLYRTARTKISSIHFHYKNALRGLSVSSTMDQFSVWIKAMCYCPQEFTIDLYLRQYWRDERLVHQLEGPLTLSSGINKQLWLPSTYFLRAKLAYFHDVTTDNYLLQIQPDGSIFYSVRYRKGHSYCTAFSWQSIWSGDGSFAIEPWKCLQSKKKADMSNSWSRGYITTVPELYLLIHIIDRAGSFARKSTYRLIDWLIN